MRVSRFFTGRVQVDAYRCWNVYSRVYAIPEEEKIYPSNAGFQAVQRRGAVHGEEQTGRINPAGR